MAQGLCAVGRDSASVDAVAAVDRALGTCASVMMPAVSDMRASSVEVPGDFWEKGGIRVALPRVFRLWTFQALRASIKDSVYKLEHVSGRPERELTQIGQF